ncbi:MAG: hypothetical protein IJ762_02360 [Bacteroidaceae bacterium]|nr:hypothetical protein [Bacteroidaceae bacterium]
MEQQNVPTENLQNAGNPQYGAAPQQPYGQQPYTQYPPQQPYGPNYAYGQPGNVPVQPEATGWRRLLGGISWSTMFSSIVHMLVMNVIYRKLFNRS